jgi:hypothetical protein
MKLTDLQVANRISFGTMMLFWIMFAFDRSTETLFPVIIWAISIILTFIYSIVEMNKVNTKFSVMSFIASTAAFLLVAYGFFKGL